MIDEGAYLPELYNYKHEPLNEIPVALLKNGTIVVNFSSPHKFLFDCGTVLDEVSHETCELYSLKLKEDVNNSVYTNSGKTISFITPNVKLTDEVMERVNFIINVNYEKVIDYYPPSIYPTVVICSRIMIDALRKDNPASLLQRAARTQNLHFAGVRMSRRLGKETGTCDSSVFVGI